MGLKDSFIQRVQGMGLKDLPLLRDLDRTLAIAGVVFSILMVIMGIIAGKFMYPILGGLVLISCILWLAIRKRGTIDLHLPESRTMSLSCAVCFFGLYVLSVLSVYLRPEIYERPLLYFALTALMAGAIAYSIFVSGRQYTGLILIQIMLLGVNIAWSQLLIFPDVLGVDPWYHSAFTNPIIDGGFIPEGYSYSKLPLFHLIITLTSLTAALPYKFATMASVSLGQIICNALLVYLIANYAFKNYRVGLLAALLVIIANHHIFMSYWSIPNAFAAVFIPTALYLLLFGFTSDRRPKFAILYVVVAASIILTHTITAMCMAILLFIIWGVLAVYQSSDSATETHVPLLVPVSFTIAMLIWWTFVTGSMKILIDLIRSAFSIDYFIATPEEFRNLYMPFGEQVFNSLGEFSFFAISLIGILYMISRRGNDLTVAIAWAGITPLVIGFFPVIFGLAVIEHRWFYFAQILLSVPLAVAIHMVGTRGPKSPTSCPLLISGFVIALSFLMIMSPAANIDNTEFSPNTIWRVTLIESELHAQTILDHYGGVSKSDVYHSNALRHMGYDAQPFCAEVATQDLQSMGGDLILIRDTIRRDPFMLFSTPYKLGYDLKSAMNVADFGQVYDSGSVYAYL